MSTRARREKLQLASHNCVQLGASVCVSQVMASEWDLALFKIELVRAKLNQGHWGQSLSNRKGKGPGHTHTCRPTVALNETKRNKYKKSAIEWNKARQVFFHLNSCCILTFTCSTSLNEQLWPEIWTTCELVQCPLSPLTSGQRKEHWDVSWPTLSLISYLNTFRQCNLLLASLSL